MNEKSKNLKKSRFSIFLQFSYFSFRETVASKIPPSVYNKKPSLLAPRPESSGSRTIWNSRTWVGHHMGMTPATDPKQFSMW